MLAFTVSAADVYATGGLHLTADFNATINAATLDAADLRIDGAVSALSFTLQDADTVNFYLPTLSVGSHTLSIAAGAIQSSTAEGLDAFSKTITIASAPQYVVKHNPRLQPGNAPLFNFPGGELDRVDILWQTIPGGLGTQDTFTVEYKAAASAGPWQSTSLNAAIDTGVESRFVRSATITGLNWNSNYTYRVRQYLGDVIVNEYVSTFRTRLQAGDSSSFTFAAYGDSAQGSAAGFRQVQSRINQINPAFAVLLGDNVYDAGTHQEADARFSASVNPEAATWMASHIDYLGLGNHDVATGSGLPSEQNYSVPVPSAGVNSPAAPPATERAEHNFSWDYGNIHFVTFDTNSLSDATRLDGLLKWVLADLQASTATWKIVYGHHPLAGVPDKPESPSDNYYQQVVNRLKAAGVDLFMTGHSHTYSWTYPLTGQVNGVATFEDSNDHDHFLSGVGLPQLVSGVGGRDLRPGSFSSFPFVAAGYTSETATPSRLGFSQVDVTPTQLTVKYIAADDGSTIDSFVINKDVGVQTATFQQGVGGYTATTDTFLHQNTPAIANGSATSLKVDGDDPAGTGLDAQALLRFENLFGSAAGQIPANATIRSATLQLQTTNGGDSLNVHRMLKNWTANDPWNAANYSTNGIQADGSEAVVSPDTSTGFSQVGTVSFNVLPSLRAWKSNPSANFGWALLPTGTDGVDFQSSEGTTPPKLIVTYVTNAVNSAPIAVNDSASLNQNASATIAVLTNDTDADGDPLIVQSVTAPGRGAAVLNANQSITYTPPVGYYGTDSFSYVISDGRGGASTATVSVNIVPLNLQTLVFQQGLNAYSGTVDTFVVQNAPTTSNAVATSLNVDGDDPGGTGLDVQALLRFNNLFGAAAIPAGARLQSAILNLQVTNPGASLNLHRMLRSWSDSDTWNSLVGGIQNDNVEAVQAADVATSAVATGTFSVNVLPSLQAWQANPALNFGWAILPTGTDGVDFDSAEGTVKPLLTVTYVPNVAPSISSLADQSTLRNQPLLNLPFVVGDPESLATSLAVTATSDNTTLFPSGGITLSGTGANRTLSLTPAANQFGATTIRVTVTDPDGGTAVTTLNVTVRLETQYVTSLQATTTGAQFSFSQPVVVGPGLNLYDYKNPLGVAVLGPADVQLTNSGGVGVSGTLTVDATNTVFTFVATGGVLPPDTYTLRVRSAANGFHTSSGALLDGNSDGTTGDDFVSVFSVAAAPPNAVVVSLPSFVRGPQQSVNIPATSALGLPIKVSDGANLTALQFDLAFDTGLLDVTNVTSLGGGAATLTSLGAGRVRISLSFAAPLGAGGQTVGYLTVAVPLAAATRYGERGVLDLSNLALTVQGGGSRPAIDQDAVQVNAYFGDVGRNGRYDSFDVQQVSRLALDLDTGFQKHPLVDPVLFADFNDNGRIDSFDTQRVSRLALDLPITETSALPNPLPTVTDTERLTAWEPQKSTTSLRSDLDASGTVDAQDVLWSVYLFGLSSNGKPSAGVDLGVVDLNLDGQFDSADVLITVSDLEVNQAQGEGESPVAQSLDDLAYLLALDTVRVKKKAGG